MDKCKLMLVAAIQRYRKARSDHRLHLRMYKLSTDNSIEQIRFSNQIIGEASARKIEAWNSLQVLRNIYYNGVYR